MSKEGYFADTGMVCEVRTGNQRRTMLGFLYRYDKRILLSVMSVSAVYHSTAYLLGHDWFQV